MKLEFSQLLETAIQLSEKSVITVAQESGISRSFIYSLLAGDQKNPSFATVCALAKVLKVRLDYFSPPDSE